MRIANKIGQSLVEYALVIVVILMAVPTLYRFTETVTTLTQRAEDSMVSVGGPRAPESSPTPTPSPSPKRGG